MLKVKLQHNRVISELKSIRLEERRSGNAKPRPRIKRVDLGRQNFDAPGITTYKCMVDEDWYNTHIAGTALEDELRLYPEEAPEGFEFTEPDAEDPSSRSLSELPSDGIEPPSSASGSP